MKPSMVMKLCLQHIKPVSYTHLDYNSDGNTTVTAVPTMDPDAMDNTKPTETPDNDSENNTDKDTEAAPTKKPADNNDNTDVGDSCLLYTSRCV